MVTPRTAPSATTTAQATLFKLQFTTNLLKIYSKSGDVLSVISAYDELISNVGGIGKLLQQLQTQQQQQQTIKQLQSVYNNINSAIRGTATQV